MQRLRLNMAMGAVGLTGRDPGTLSTAEKAAVATALQSMPAKPPPSSTTAATQAVQQMQQQLLHCQSVIAQQQKQQQLMAQQYQQLVAQLQQVLGVGGGHMKPPQQQQQQQQQPPLQPRQGGPKSPMMTIDAEEAMMKYLQGTTPPPPGPMQPAPSYPMNPMGMHPSMGAPSTLAVPQPQIAYTLGAQQTAMESMAQRLAGVKRPRSESMTAVSHPADAFLNMPDFEGAAGSSSSSGGAGSSYGASNTSLPLSEATGDRRRSDVGADLILIRSFDKIHDLRIASVHASVDSMLIVAAGRDKRVSVFNAANQTLIGVLPVLHRERVTRARFALAGARRYLVTGSFDRSIHVWDLGLVGTPLDRLPEEPLAIYKDDHGGLPVSLDTSSLADPVTGSIDIFASCDTEGVLIIRSIQDGTILHRRHDASGAMVRMIGFEPNGDAHIALSLESRVDIYNWRTGQIVYTISPPDGRPVIGVSWDPGLIIVTTDAACYAWVVDFCLPPSAKPSESYTGRCVAIFNPRGVKLNAGIIVRDGDAPLETFMVSRQSRIILVGGWRRIFVWRIDFDRVSASGKKDERSLCYGVDAHDDLVAWITATTNHASHVVATGGFDNKVIMWKLDAILEHQVMEQTSVPVQTLPQPAVVVQAEKLPVEELAQPIDFDPISMFLNTDDL